MPALDEAFAQSLKTESVDDLKAKIRAQLVIAKAQMLREIMIESVMEQLLERSTVEVSDNSWEDIANRRLTETLEEQREAGKTMEDYAQENGMTLEELVQAWREKAQLYIKRAFLIREVFVAEKLSLSNEDLNMELAMMANEYNVELKEMADMLQKNNALEELRFRAISRKVSDVLLSKADMREAGAPKVGSSLKSSKPAKSAGAQKPDLQNVAKSITSTSKLLNLKTQASTLFSRIPRRKRKLRANAYRSWRNRWESPTLLSRPREASAATISGRDFSRIGSYFSAPKLTTTSQI